ncbi:hypothetical protein SB781_03415 [Paraburkholderia sp. SIMBA_061]
MSAVYVDRFSAGLDDLTRKQQGDHIAVLRVLNKTGRFSCFEASENQTIARTMDFILHSDLVQTTDNGYPWTGVKLTDAGRAALEANP